MAWGRDKTTLDCALCGKPWVSTPKRRGDCSFCHQDSFPITHINLLPMGLFAAISINGNKRSVWERWEKRETLKLQKSTRNLIYFVGLDDLLPPEFSEEDYKEFAYLSALPIDAHYLN